MQSVTVSVPVLTGLVLCAALWSCPLSAEQAAGVFMNKDATTITIWTDGVDEAVKYTLGADPKVYAEVFQAIFPNNRVLVTYKLDGDSRQLLSIQKARTQSTGTVTGSAIYTDNKFCIILKTRDGQLDGFGASWPPEKFKDVLDTLKALKTSDTVSIRFATDGERHRILGLQILPAAGSAGASPFGAPAAPSAKPAAARNEDLAAAPPAPIATYVLKNGTRLKALKVEDGGQQVMITDENNKHHVIAKDDIAEIVKGHE